MNYPGFENYSCRLYESHGLLAADIGRLAALRSLEFDSAAFGQYLEEQRRQSKAATALAHALSRPGGGVVVEERPETRDEFKYEYSRSPTGKTVCKIGQLKDAKCTDFLLIFIHLSLLRI